MGNAQAKGGVQAKGGGDDLSYWYQADDATKKKATSHRTSRKSVLAMDPIKKRVSDELYDEFLPVLNDDGSVKSSRALDRVSLRRMLSDIHDEHFDVVWRLFDTTGSGLVDKDQFVVAMVRSPSVLAALTRLWNSQNYCPHPSSPPFLDPAAPTVAVLSPQALLTSDSRETYGEQLGAVFFMFDTTRTGVLTSEEFEGMVRAMVNLKLGSLLQENTFVGEFKKYLEKEFSSENLAFWQAAKEYEELKEDVARLPRALELNAKHVEDGSPEQVNLPADLVKAIAKQLGEKQAPKDLFKSASDEIFKLMEKDTLSRFRQDPKAIEKLLDSFYKAVDLTPGKPVTFIKFKQWALREPTVLGLFTGISASIRELLEERTSKLPPAPVTPEVNLTATSAASGTTAAKASSPHDGSPQSGSSTPKMGFFRRSFKSTSVPGANLPLPQIQTVKSGIR